MVGIPCDGKLKSKFSDTIERHVHSPELVNDTKQFSTLHFLQESLKLKKQRYSIYYSINMPFGIEKYQIAPQKFSLFI